MTTAEGMNGAIEEERVMQRAGDENLRSRREVEDGFGRFEAGGPGGMAAGEELWIARGAGGEAPIELGLVGTPLVV